MATHGAGTEDHAYAFELARSLPVRLHLLHVLPAAGRAALGPGVPLAPLAVLDERMPPAVATARQQLEALVPYDLEHRTSVHVETGDPAARIAEVSQRLGTSCILMGTPARRLPRRLFTRNTSRAQLHLAPCPVGSCRRRKRPERRQVPGSAVDQGGRDAVPDLVVEPGQLRPVQAGLDVVGRVVAGAGRRARRRPRRATRDPRGSAAAADWPRARPGWER